MGRTWHQKYLEKGFELYKKIAMDPLNPIASIEDVLRETDILLVKMKHKDITAYLSVPGSLVPDALTKDELRSMDPKHKGMDYVVLYTRPKPKNEQDARAKT